MATDPKPPVCRILPNAQAAVPVLLDELRAVVARGGRPLLGFATGGTYQAMLQRLAQELQLGRPGVHEFTATHLDEYLGHPPERAGGMAHELMTLCPPLREMWQRGAFLPVPHDGGDAGLRAHEERLRQHGGVRLQLLGIGRNGHIAFNEPGTPFELGFHATTLAATTREDARARFAPAEVPMRAVTSGVRTILAAHRVVLCAFGRAKAAAVQAMLEGPYGTPCPASALQRHGQVLVLLDPEAASLLSPAAQKQAAVG